MSVYLYHKRPEFHPFDDLAYYWGFLNKSNRDISESCRQQNILSKFIQQINTVMGSFRKASCFLWPALVSAPVRRSVHRMGRMFSSDFSPCVNQRWTTGNLFFFFFLFSSFFGCLTFYFVLGPFSFPTPTSILPGKYFHDYPLISTSYPSWCKSRPYLPTNNHPLPTYPLSFPS